MGPCGLYDRIDALNEAQTVQTLVAALRPILYDLAHYAVNGEGAISDYHEGWRREYADHLYNEAGAERAAPRSEAKAPGGPSEAEARQPMPNRSRPGDVPASLMAIMQGNHPSFREDD